MPGLHDLPRWRSYRGKGGRAPSQRGHRHPGRCRSWERCFGAGVHGCEPLQRLATGLGSRGAKS